MASCLVHGGSIRIIGHVILICSLFSFNSVLATFDFCYRNTLKHDSTYLQFTKEVNLYDFAYVSKAKTLDCCVKGYDVIKWTKNGKPLSTNWNYEAKNQTLVQTEIHKSDEGNYTCEASNRTHTISKIIHLKTKVIVENYSKPIPIGEPKTQYKEVGEDVRLMCSAYLGESFMRRGYWTRHYKGRNETFVRNSSHIAVYDEWSEENYALYTYLEIRGIKMSDFGTYKCYIRKDLVPRIWQTTTLIKGVDPNYIVKTSYKGALVLIGIFLILFAVLTSFYVHFRLPIHLFLKDRFGKLEEGDENEWDVFMLYAEEDTDLAVYELLHGLEDRLGYKCFVYERDSLAGAWIPETYPREISRSRRVVALLTPELLRCSWGQFALHLALQQLMSLHSKVICITTEEFPKSQEGEEEVTKSLRRAIRMVRRVQWPGSDSSLKSQQRFWQELRLLLPPRRPRSLVSDQSLIVHETSLGRTTPILTPKMLLISDYDKKNNFI